MMRVNAGRAVAVALVVTTVVAVAGPSEASESAPAITESALASLDGIWMFDEKRSDSPRKVMESARPERGGAGFRGGRRGGPPGGGFGGGPPGGMRDGPSEGREQDGEETATGSAGRRDALARVMHPAAKVVIEVLADQVNVAEDERTPRAYAIEDSLAAHRHDLVTEGTSARWKSGRLVMTQTLSPRGALVETYELSKDGGTLTIRARREGGPSGMPNPTFTRVYTRYQGD